MTPRAARLRWSAAVLAATVLAVTACGVDAGDRAAPTTTAAPAPEGAPPTTAAAPTTTTDAEAATPADDGTTFEGDGYLIDVGPTWTESDASMARGIEFWAVGDSVAGLQPNVNVLVQDQTAATGSGLEAYRAISEDGIAAIGGEVLSSEIVTGSDGQELLRMDFRAEQQGNELRFLGIAVEVEGGFALATFTAPVGDFDGLVGDVEPYLLTLRPAG